MKKILAGFMAFCLAVSFVGCSSDGAENPGGGGSSAAVDTTDNKERITFKTQLYEGDNIIEIPYIEYEGENDQLEFINQLYYDNSKKEYDDFMASKDDRAWMEMKSYPFTSDRYLQVVISTCIYPTYGTQGYVSCLNYDRVTKQWITLAFTIGEMGLTEEKILDAIKNAYVSEYDGEEIVEVALEGHLNLSNGDYSEVVFIAKITLNNPDGDQHDILVAYSTDKDNNGDVTRLDNQCFFNADMMDRMNPPLSYQRMYGDYGSDDSYDTYSSDESYDSYDSYESEDSVEANSTNEKLTFITQEYDGQNIAEIPYISFDGENPELDSINNLYNQGLQQQYETFMSGRADDEWVEIRSYPFTSEKYLQVVTTTNIYPNDDTVGTIESVNYDREAKKVLTIDDALEMAGMSSDEAVDDVIKVMANRGDYDEPANVEICGFMFQVEYDYMLYFLLKLTFDDGTEGFFNYYPGVAVNELDSKRLFGFNDVDKTDEPLAFVREENAIPKLSDDMIFNNTWVSAETGEEMVFVKEQFIQYNDSWEDNPDETYYDFDESKDKYNIFVYMGGGRSSHTYFNYIPETGVLVEHAFGDIVDEWTAK